MIGAIFSDHSANRLELTEENNLKWLMKRVQELSGKSSVSFEEIFSVFLLKVQHLFRKSSLSLDEKFSIFSGNLQYLFTKSSASFHKIFPVLTFAGNSLFPAGLLQSLRGQSPGMAD